MLTKDIFRQLHITKFNSLIRKTNNCWWWEGTIIHGYGMLCATHTNEKGLKTRYILAHRFSHLINIGPVPTDLLVCHKCNNKLCVNPKHLYLGTNKQNIQDAERDGLIVHVLGEQHGCSKLTKEQVLSIRKEYKELKTSHVKLGLKYNVGATTIRDCLTGRSWGYLT